MPIAVILDFEGGTAAQYDAVMADMDLGGKLPPGAVLHTSGATEGGWRVVDLWDDAVAFGGFAEERIMPISAAHGLPEPRVQVVDLAEVAEGSGAPGFVQIVRLAVPEDKFLEMHTLILPERLAPLGAVLHTNGPTEDGWIIVDFWVDQGARDAFLQERIVPVMRSSGLEQRPVIEDMRVHAALTERV
jgi:hypothetical protein